MGSFSVCPAFLTFRIREQEIRSPRQVVGPGDVHGRWPLDAVGNVVAHSAGGASGSFILGICGAKRLGKRFHVDPCGG